MELSASARGGPPPRRWLGVARTIGFVLALSVVGAATGCAKTGLSRAEMDATLYADCVRSGGIWHGDNQFGGSCHFRGPSR